MPLPFLRPKAVAGLIISQRKPDGGKEETHSQENEGEGLESAMGDLCRAMASKDEKSMAAAFRAAFQILESEPHDETSDSSDMPAEDDNSFDAQNIRAAKERR